MGDTDFDQGQLANAKALGDTGTTDSSGKFVPDWLPAFKSEIDGLILVRRLCFLCLLLFGLTLEQIAGESQETVHEQKHKVEHILGNSIHKALVVEGRARPGKEKGHEHFVRDFPLVYP